MGLAVIFATALALVLAPPLVDRWAARRGASPATLGALALVTLAGLAAVGLAFVICTATLTRHGNGAFGIRLAVVAGLLLVAVAAGRAIAQAVRLRRRSLELSRGLAALGPHRRADGVNVLPVGDVLAFVAGTDAFVSRGLLDRLSPAQQRAVIEHEREHASARHGRLAAAARALSHGLFRLPVARRAEATLERELDVLADRAAARRLGDPGPVREALVALSARDGARSGDGEGPIERRIARLGAGGRAGSAPAEAAVRALTLALAVAVFASLCVSFHASGVWLGVMACAAALVGFLSLARPLLAGVGSGERQPQAEDQRQKGALDGLRTRAG